MSLLLAIFIIATALLFVTGLYSLLVTRNLIRIVMSLEILTKGVTLIMLGAGYINGNMAAAQAYVITIIILEVVLLAVATGIVLGVYRRNGSLNARKLNNLKG
ncbi:MAG: NADH-quinone oxidoreductase subunit K [Clostridia bacterium]|nr:NADH-quinone oxidoreductase subunit K [Clostridia bacterium]